MQRQGSTTASARKISLLPGTSTSGGTDVLAVLPQALLADKVRAAEAAAAKKAEKADRLAHELHEAHAINELLQRQLDLLINRAKGGSGLVKMKSQGALLTADALSYTGSVFMDDGQSIRRGLASASKRTPGLVSSHSPQLSAVLSPALNSTSAAWDAQSMASAPRGDVWDGRINASTHSCVTDVDVTIREGELGFTLCPVPDSESKATKAVSDWALMVDAVVAPGESPSASQLAVFNERQGPDPCCGVVKAGMVLIGIGGQSLKGVPAAAVRKLLKHTPRPTVLRFREVTLQQLRRKYEELQSRCAPVVDCVVVAVGCRSLLLESR